MSACCNVINIPAAYNANLDGQEQISRGRSIKSTRARFSFRRPIMPSIYIQMLFGLGVYKPPLVGSIIFLARARPNSPWVSQKHYIKLMCKSQPVNIFS